MTRRYVMCRPTYFAVEYVINPWMDPADPVDTDRAIAQWEALVRTYRDLGHTVHLIDPVPGLPDMVFTANGATAIDGVVLGARFRYPQRAAEAPAHLDWFARHGFAVREPRYVNEGQGDLLLAGEYLLAGAGTRTDPGAHAQAREVFGRPVVSLDLVDPRYYHLDTALCVLGGPADIAYLPDAFSSRSRTVLRRLFPRAITASARDAAVLGLNGVSDGRRVVLPAQATGLMGALSDHGYQVIGVDLSEMRKAGGGPKCCTLEIHGAPDRVPASTDLIGEGASP